MNFGIPREVRPAERRVALLPAGVESLTKAGHTVYVEHSAGAQSLFSDEEYRAAGASIAYSAGEITGRSDVILKIAPLTEEEVGALRPGQVVFSFLHLAVSHRRTVEVLLEREVTAVAYELMEDGMGGTPILQVMSEIAGQQAIQTAAHFLQSRQGGRGILLGNIPGVPPASVVILGAGTVGTTAARAALGFGADVTVLDNDLSRLRALCMGTTIRANTWVANSYNVARAVRYADVVIGAVLLKGERAPHLVTEAMVHQMKMGSVIIDVSIDQGGCVETSRPTTIDDPVFVHHGVVHYCVPNMTAAVPRTASAALTNTVLPYLMYIGERGMHQALREHAGLAKGVCTFSGGCTHPAVAKVFDLQHRHLTEMLPSHGAAPSSEAR